jgi:hypothetical protein
VISRERPQFDHEPPRVLLDLIRATDGVPVQWDISGWCQICCQYYPFLRWAESVKLCGKQSSSPILIHISVPSERESFQSVPACQATASGSGEATERSIRQNTEADLQTTEQPITLSFPQQTSGEILPAQSPLQSMSRVADPHDTAMAIQALSLQRRAVPGFASAGLGFGCAGICDLSSAIFHFWRWTIPEVRPSYL